MLWAEGFLNQFGCFIYLFTSAQDDRIYLMVGVIADKLLLKDFCDRFMVSC